MTDIDTAIQTVREHAGFGDCPCPPCQAFNDIVAEIERLRAEVKENETAFGKADALLTYQKARIEKLEKALWKGIRWTRKALEYEPDWLGEARAALEGK